MGKARQEREKLLHKYKREMKGAIREIRRDKSFLAKLKFKETLQK
jgi:nucleolar protein 14